MPDPWILAVLVAIITLPLGVTATLDADERRLTIDQPALAPDAYQ